MIRSKILNAGSPFWQFHISFWVVAGLLLLVSGLSQGASFNIATLRNLMYALLGFGSCLTFLGLWEAIASWSDKVKVFAILVFAWGVGIVMSLLVNATMLYVFSAPGEHSLLAFLFGGSLNFSLVVLVWCGFYLSLKHGLSFEQGIEEQKTAQAIASISNVSGYPQYVALEKLNKVVLVPVDKISAIRASGDYVELSSEGEVFLKRSTLSSIETLFNPEVFQRVHRSAIVNLKHIQQMESKGRGDFTIILNSGELISCSRTYMDRLKNRLDIAM